MKIFHIWYASWLLKANQSMDYIYSLEKFQNGGQRDVKRDIPLWGRAISF